MRTSGMIKLYAVALFFTALAQAFEAQAQGVNRQKSIREFHEFLDQIESEVLEEPLAIFDNKAPRFLGLAVLACLDPSDEGKTQATRFIADGALRFLNDFKRFRHAPPGTSSPYASIKYYLDILKDFIGIKESGQAILRLFNKFENFPELPQAAKKCLAESTGNSMRILKSGINQTLIDGYEGPHFAVKGGNFIHLHTLTKVTFKDSPNDLSRAAARAADLFFLIGNLDVGALSGRQIQDALHDAILLRGVLTHFISYGLVDAHHIEMNGDEVLIPSDFYNGRFFSNIEALALRQLKNIKAAYPIQGLLDDDASPLDALYDLSDQVKGVCLAKELIGSEIKGWEEIAPKFCDLLEQLDEKIAARLKSANSTRKKQGFIPDAGSLAQSAADKERSERQLTSLGDRVMVAVNQSVDAALIFNLMAEVRSPTLKAPPLVKAFFLVPLSLKLWTLANALTEGKVKNEYLQAAGQFLRSLRKNSDQWELMEKAKVNAFLATFALKFAPSLQINQDPLHQEALVEFLETIRAIDDEYFEGAARESTYMDSGDFTGYFGLMDFYSEVDFEALAKEALDRLGPIGRGGSRPYVLIDIAQQRARKLFFLEQRKE